VEPQPLAPQPLEPQPLELWPAETWPLEPQSLEPQPPSKVAQPANRPSHERVKTDNIRRRMVESLSKKPCRRLP